MSDCDLSTTLPAIDYFACLGVPRQLNIESHLLEARFHERQRQFHPDRFIGSSPLEQRAAAVFSANLNEAFQTLKHPEKRVRYWLMFHGIDVNARIQLPPERLMQHLSWREQIDRDANLQSEVQSQALIQLHNQLQTEHQHMWQSLMRLCGRLPLELDNTELKGEALLAFHDVCFLNKCLAQLNKS